MDRQVFTPASAGALAALLLWGCGREPDAPVADPPLRPQERSGPTVRFADVTAVAGIHFKHTSGPAGRKYGVEALGSGAAFFDYNGDGYMDLYVVNGADLPGHISPQPPRNALYRNRADGRFVETAAGVADSGYGMPVIAVLFFFVLTALAALLLKSLSRHLAFTRADLILIYAMMLVAGAVVTTGFTGGFMSIISGIYYYATPENNWANFFIPHLNPYLTPQDPEAVHLFFEGCLQTLRFLGPLGSYRWPRGLLLWWPFRWLRSA